MVLGGLTAIFFVVTLAAWAMCSMIYVTFACHYLLTTLTDSSSGQDEVQYPREGLIDWWWKPVLCGWVTLIWFIPVTFILSPLNWISPWVFIIVWAMTMWFVIPLSLASVLYAQNWVVFIHRGVVGRMLRHYWAFAYVYVVTFLMAVGCVYVLILGLWDIVWLFVGAGFLPAVVLLYGRYWGRLAWLSLNFLPSQSKRPALSLRSETPEETFEEPLPELIPEMSVEEVEDAAAEAFRDDPPPIPEPAPQPLPAPAVEDYDEWTDLGPYDVIGDSPHLTTTPVTEEVKASPPSVPVTPDAEEEDEWATDKKPYAFKDFDVPTETDSRSEVKPVADTPIDLAKYYDDKAAKEAALQRKRAKERLMMPKRSKKTPTFRAALVSGVWGFALYPGTWIVWANLAALSAMELFLMFMLRAFFPKAL